MSESGHYKQDNQNPSGADGSPDIFQKIEVSEIKRSWRDYATIHSLIPLTLFFLFGIFIFFEVLHPWVRDRTAFITAPPGLVTSNPVQTKSATQPFAHHGKYGAFYTRSHTYVITPLWDYSLTARVLHVREFYSSANAADLVPFDLGLGWGAMSDAYALRRYFIFSHENLWGRTLWVKWRGDWEDIPPDYIKEAQTGIHYSNNHVVPANDEVYETLKTVQAGDIVTLKGRLVDIDLPGKQGWTRKTSRYDRNDPVKDSRGGDVAAKWTTCDTFFIESATIEKASSLRYLFQ